MNLLAIDTSTPACSVALRVGQQMHERHVVEPRAHTRILIPMIDGLLQQAGLSVGDLDAVILGNGPGSFIGMRIGASVAQGLCFAAQLKVVPVSSLSALAAEVIAEHGAERVIVAQDARMQEIYVGRFRRAGDHVESEEPEVIVPVGPLPVSGNGVVSAAGEAWHRYPDLLDANRAIAGRVIDLRYPRASYVLDLGARSLDSAVDPTSLRPAYLRTKVAEPLKTG